MLIVLGGFLGSGRKILSREIAEKHGVKLYEMKQHLLRRWYRAADGRVDEYSIRPRTDDDRMRLYEKSVKDLPLLAKLHDDVIIERAFNRGLREYFLAQARQFFRPVVFVWIESDEDHALRLMRRMVRRRLLRSVEDGMAIRELQKKEFQPLLDVTPVFHNHSDRKQAADELWQLIQELAAR